jgi:hypothetical protein
MENVGWTKSWIERVRNVGLVSGNEAFVSSSLFGKATFNGDLSSLFMRTRKNGGLVRHMVWSRRLFGLSPGICVQPSSRQRAVGPFEMPSLSASLAEKGCHCGPGGEQGTHSAMGFENPQPAFEGFTFLSIMSQV